MTQYHKLQDLRPSVTQSDFGAAKLLGKSTRKFHTLMEILSTRMYYIIIIIIILGV